MAERMNRRHFLALAVATGNAFARGNKEPTRPTKNQNSQDSDLHTTPILTAGQNFNPNNLQITKTKNEVLPSPIEYNLSPERKHPGDIFYNAFNGGSLDYPMVAYGGPASWGSIGFGRDGIDRGAIQNTTDTWEYLSSFLPTGEQSHFHGDVVGINYKKVDGQSLSQPAVNTQSLNFIADILNGKLGPNATVSFNIRAGGDVSTERLFTLIKALYEGTYTFYSNGQEWQFPSWIFNEAGITLSLDLEEPVNIGEGKNPMYPSGIPASELYEIVSWVNNFMINRGFNCYPVILYEQGVEPHIVNGLNPSVQHWNDKLSLVHSGFLTTGNSSSENLATLLHAYETQKRMYGVIGIGGMLYTHKRLDPSVRNALDTIDIIKLAEYVQCLVAQ